MAKKFLRTDHMRFSRLGKKRKSLQKWRKAKGRDNKIREKRFGYPKSPAVGYKTPAKDAGKIRGKVVSIVKNLNDLERADKNSVIIIAKIGAKKKIEIMKRAVEKNMDVINISGGLGRK